MSCIFNNLLCQMLFVFEPPLLTSTYRFDGKIHVHPRALIYKK